MPELWIADGAQRFLPPLHDLWQHEWMFVRGETLSLAKNVVLHCPICLRERGEMISYALQQKYCVVCQCDALEPLEFTGHVRPVCRIDEVMDDFAASFWLKDALRSALERDPVDAANDAEVLARLLSTRFREILGHNSTRENSNSYAISPATRPYPGSFQRL
jgi:hypothetical protein